MIPILIAFYIFVALFAIIGASRGWAKELLVIFSVILALAFIAVVENLIPVLSRTITSNPRVKFWFEMITVIVMAFFGYQSPKLVFLAKAAVRREAVQDTLLGLILGAFSGYMVIGSLWYYLASIGYWPPYIVPPQAGTGLGEAAVRLVAWLPPQIIGTSPNIFIAVVLAFIFVIVVFI